MSYTSILNTDVWPSPLTGNPNANSYVSFTEMNAILGTNRLYCPEWLAAAAGGPTPSTDAVAIWASAWLDKTVEWNGYRATRDQALRWPRSGCYDRDGFYVDKDKIPQHIKDITAQLAYEFLKKYRFVEPVSLGIGISGPTRIGPLNLNLNPNNYTPFIPKYLQAEISHWGLLNGLGMGSGTIVTARLVRG